MGDHQPAARNTSPIGMRNVRFLGNQQLAAQNVGPVGMKNKPTIVDDLLPWRALHAGALSPAVCTFVILAANMEADTWRAVVFFTPMPLSALLTACVIPIASSHYISPGLERSLLLISSAGTVAAARVWAKYTTTHPCHYLAMVPGFLMCLACASVPLLSVTNVQRFWPALRYAFIASGLLQLARLAAQAHALRLAFGAAALGLPDLIPMRVAVQCQAHSLFLSGGVTQSAALSFGCVLLLTGIALTPSVRMVLATVTGRFGLPTSKVLHLGDGILLEPGKQDDDTFPAAASCCSEMTSGPFEIGVSLWSGWSAKWSDPGETPSAKLSASFRNMPLGPDHFTRLQNAIRAAKARISENEVSKAKRRAAHRGKEYGKLVWLLLRRSQKYPQSKVSSVPPDALRIIVGFVREDETARLEHLYSSRVLEGAGSYRG